MFPWTSSTCFQGLRPKIIGRISSNKNRPGNQPDWYSRRVLLQGSIKEDDGGKRKESGRWLGERLGSCNVRSFNFVYIKISIWSCNLKEHFQGKVRQMRLRSLKRVCVNTTGSLALHWILDKLADRGGLLDGFVYEKISNNTVPYLLVDFFFWWLRSCLSRSLPRSHDLDLDLDRLRLFERDFPYWRDLGIYVYVIETEIERLTC